MCFKTVMKLLHAQLFGGPFSRDVPVMSSPLPLEGVHVYKIKYVAFTVVAVQRNKGHTNVCEQERSHTNVCEQERSYPIGFLCVLEIC